VKCQQCSQFLDFSESSKQIAEKSARLDVLQGLLESLTNDDFARRVPSEGLSAAFAMIKSNLHRRIPAINFRHPGDTAMDAEWPHLTVVYKILDAILQSTSLRFGLVQSQVNEHLIGMLFQNAVAPDARECAAACECLSAIAQRHCGLRKVITPKCTFFLVMALDSAQFERALPSLLSFMRDSWDVLRFPELRKFFVRVLCRLMTLAGLAAFQAEFFSLVGAVLSRDPQLAPLFAHYAVAHWPVQDPRKQLLFLDALRGVIGDFWKQIPRDLLRVCLLRIVDRFGDCAPDIAREALAVFADPGFLGLLAKFPAGLARAVVAGAKEVAERHWADAARWAADEVLAGIIRVGTLEDGPEQPKEAPAMWDIVRARAQEMAA
jgi:hypothetical protein